MVNPELLRYRADGGGQAAVLERPAECLAEEDDSLKHWPGVVGCVYADAGAACGQVEVGDAFVHLEEFAPLSLVVGRFIEVLSGAGDDDRAVRRASHLGVSGVAVYSRYFCWWCRTARSNTRPMRACVPGVSMPVLSPQLRRSSTLF